MNFWRDPDTFWHYYRIGAGITAGAIVTLAGFALLIAVLSGALRAFTS